VRLQLVEIIVIAVCREYYCDRAKIIQAVSCEVANYMPLKELLNEAKNLDLQEQIQLATQLLQWVEVKINQKPQYSPSKQLRQAGLGLGSCIFTTDFDDPLPDEFWLGES
jgi:hypothetical protein